MGWEAGMSYRGRAVRDQAQIEPNVNGTKAAQVMVEVTFGPMAGQRIRYRGYVNSPSNADTTAGELRAMGCKVLRWGDWSGLGSTEFVFTCIVDQGADGKTYTRAAFPRPLLKVNAERALSGSDLDDLNERLPPPPASNGAPVRLVALPTLATDEDVAFPT